MFPWHVFQSQFQALGFSLKATFAHSPLPPQSQRCGKQLFRCHDLLFQSSKTQNANISFSSRHLTKPFLRLTVRSEVRAKRLSNAKYSYLSSARSEACSSEKRNKWQGPAAGGKDAFYAAFDLEQA
jgi:hypothetical protein